MFMIKRRDTCEQYAAKVVLLWIKSLTAEHLERQEKLIDLDLCSYQPSRFYFSLGSLERCCTIN